MRFLLALSLITSLALVSTAQATPQACTFPTGSGAENLSSKILTGYFGWDSSGNVLQGTLPNYGAFNAASTALPSPGYITSIEGLSLSQICSTAQLFGQAGTASCSSTPSITITGNLSWGATTAGSSKSITLSLASSGTSIVSLTFSGAGTDGFRVQSVAGVTLNSLANVLSTQLFALDSTLQPSRSVQITPVYAGGSSKTMTLSITDGDGRVQAISADAEITGPTTTNLVLWLKADSGVTYDGSNYVSSWADQSGQGHDATQSTDGLKPLYVASAVNTLPGIRFDGSNDYLTVAGSFSIAQVYVVFKSMTTNFNNYGSVLGGSNGRPFAFESGQKYFHFSPYPTAVWKNGSSLSSPFNLSTLTNYMYLTLNPNGPSTSRTFYIGMLDTLSYYSNVEIAEILGYSSENSTETRQSVEAYLASKYGL